MKTLLKQLVKLNSMGLVWPLRRDFLTNPSPFTVNLQQCGSADCRGIPYIFKNVTPSKFCPFGLKHR